MINLTFIDSIFILYLLFSIANARKTSLAESLQKIISISLLVLLILGFRIKDEIQDLLSGLSGYVGSVPLLGSKVFVIFAAWLLMHLLRKKMAHWIEERLSNEQANKLVFWAEGFRALMIICFIAWLAAGLYEPGDPENPAVIKAMHEIETFLRKETA